MRTTLKIAVVGIALVGFMFGEIAVRAVNLGEDSKEKIPAELVLHLKINKSTADRAYQVSQNGIDLNPDGAYVVTFWAKGTATYKVGVSTKLNAPPWDFFGIRDEVQLSPEWRRYSFTFSAKGAQPNLTRLSFTLRGAETAEVWIGNIDMRPQGTAGDGMENLIANGQFNDGMLQWNLEGRQAGVFEGDVQSVTSSGVIASEN